MSWIAGHLLLYKEKQDTKEEEILNKKVNRISVTKKNRKKLYGLLGCSSNTKRSKILSFLVGTINLERREGGFLDGHVIVINIT